MERIVVISGNVTYKITLDPGVWIFDDRKVEISNYFNSSKKENNDLEEYTKSVSKHWDREIQEGAVYPPTLKTEKKFQKQKILTGSFGIPFHDFLRNANPKENATEVCLVTTSGNVKVPLKIAYEAILGFSSEGKPLIEDGPIHFYYGDGTNQDNPIKDIKEFIIK